MYITDEMKREIAVLMELAVSDPTDLLSLSGENVARIKLHILARTIWIDDFQISYTYEQGPIPLVNIEHLGILKIDSGIPTDDEIQMIANAFGFGPKSSWSIVITPDSRVTFRTSSQGTSYIQGSLKRIGFITSNNLLDRLNSLV